MKKIKLYNLLRVGEWLNSITQQCSLAVAVTMGQLKPNTSPYRLAPRYKVALSYTRHTKEHNPGSVVLAISCI